MIMLRLISEDIPIIAIATAAVAVKPCVVSTIATDKREMGIVIR